MKRVIYKLGVKTLTNDCDYWHYCNTTEGLKKLVDFEMTDNEGMIERFTFEVEATDEHDTTLKAQVVAYVQDYNSIDEIKDLASWVKIHNAQSNF